MCNYRAWEHRVVLASRIFNALVYLEQDHRRQHDGDFMLNSRVRLSDANPNRLCI